MHLLVIFTTVTGNIVRLNDSVNFTRLSKCTEFEGTETPFILLYTCETEDWKMWWLPHSLSTLCLQLLVHF